jgi:hypothetical protein
MSVAETAEMPASALSDAGFGLVTTDHALPSKCSISVCCRPPASKKNPTAHTSLAAMAATPSRVLRFVGFGVDTTLQLVPFQCSASVVG